MDIKAHHIQAKKKIGELNGKPIISLVTKGGLHLVIRSDDDGKHETLGTGPHPGIAKYLAEQREPDIKWTELSKSNHLDFSIMEPLLPEYEELTVRLRKKEGSE